MSFNSDYRRIVGGRLVDSNGSRARGRCQLMFEGARRWSIGMAIGRSMELAPWRTDHEGPRDPLEFIGAPDGGERLRGNGPLDLASDPIVGGCERELAGEASVALGWFREEGRRRRDRLRRRRVDLAAEENR